MTRCRRIERAAIARDCRMSGLGFTAASRVSSDRRRRIRHVVNRARERQQLSGDCTCLTLATARPTTDRNVFERATTTNTRVARQIARKARLSAAHSRAVHTRVYAKTRADARVSAVIKLAVDAVPPMSTVVVAGRSINSARDTRRPRLSRGCRQSMERPSANDQGLTVAADVPPTTRKHSFFKQHFFRLNDESQ